MMIHCLSLEKSMEATAEDQENLADLEKRIVTTYCSQTSDTTTITLSLVCKTIRIDTQDLGKASTERTNNGRVPNNGWRFPFSQ